MTPEAERVLAMASALPVSKRAFLADRIWVTVEDREEQPLSPSEIEEIVRRCRQVESGEAETIPLEEVMASLCEQLHVAAQTPRPPPDPLVVAPFDECLALASALSNAEREQLADRLWPDDGPEAGGACLGSSSDGRDERIDGLAETPEPQPPAPHWTPDLERRAREALRGENLAGELHEVLDRARTELEASRRDRRGSG